MNFPSQLELYFEQLLRHRRKLQPLLIHPTLGKQAKRMPDITDETTNIVVN